MKWLEGRSERRVIQETWGIGVGCEKGFDFAPKRLVAGALLAEKLGALLCRAFQRRLKQRANPFPVLGRDHLVLPLSSRDSHALASAQSRFTVIGATPMTAAISSPVSPPKKRSSTSRLCR